MNHRQIRVTILARRRKMQKSCDREGRAFDTIVRSVLVGRGVTVEVIVGASEDLELVEVRDVDVDVDVLLAIELVCTQLKLLPPWSERFKPPCQFSSDCKV